MNESKLDKDYPNLQFESDEDALKMFLFYFLKELMLKFSGSAAGLIGDSSPFSRVDSLSVDSIEGHNQVSGKGFPTTGPRFEAGSIIIHRGLYVSNVTASCSLCAIGCKELFTNRHRCPDVLYIVVMLMGYAVNWNCMSMDFKVLRLIGASFGITRLIGVSFRVTRLICASFGITRLLCASFGITRLIRASFGITRVRVQRGADRRGARRMREGHMDASGFLYASADARIEEIELTDEEHAYLDWSLKIPMIEGYEDNPPACVEHPLLLLVSSIPMLLATIVVPRRSRNGQLRVRRLSFNNATIVLSTNDQNVDREMGTSISKDSEDGIVLIDISWGEEGEDVSPSSV
ncbi:hypothetical protein E6C27_scaffold233G00640 [Cucumis melo var. makuwa]|uniref:Uncharacterized protein n=1 Tax=Cucumis melo var. makuwa TaxID=1194695 RepID=A0A5A7UZT1_CUCMM|nr:hypothetical protein E6C27_scaffold233G00640 [Cucumis melo var. makuwa]